MVQNEGDREYIIFCDESDSSGKYYSNFYGGLLISSTYYEQVTKQLEAVKIGLGLTGELKWQKVTKQFLPQYIKFIDALFDVMAEEKLKIRIMFRPNYNDLPRLSPAERELTYFRLYYQFIKHAFGLKYIPPSSHGTKLRLYFDEFPETRERVAQFRGFLQALSHNYEFRQAGIKIDNNDIAEVRSHAHVLLQGLDIVLGSMCFRLNEKHKLKPDEAKVRGNRTIAKEKLYRHIVKRVCQIRASFNFGQSTGCDGDPANSFFHLYRHWAFQAYESEFDETKTKSYNKKNCPSNPT